MTTYHEYIASPDWQATRADALERAGHRCEVCKKPWSLQVHHLTYKDLGHETPDQLQVLCIDCHRAVHEGQR